MDYGNRWRKMLSTKRLGANDSKEHEARSAFQRDFERIWRGQVWHYGGVSGGVRYGIMVFEGNFCYSYSQLMYLRHN